MIVLVAVAIADENDVAVAGRSVGPPLRACSVVVVAAERPRQRRLAWMRNDEDSDDDVEDRGPGHPRRVDFPIAQSHALSNSEIRKGTSPYDDPSAIHLDADAVASEHVGPSYPSPSCASLPACARTVCCPFLILFDVKKINGARRESIGHQWLSGDNLSSKLQSPPVTSLRFHFCARSNDMEIDREFSKSLIIITAKNTSDRAHGSRLPACDQSITQSRKRIDRMTWQLRTTIPF